MRRRGSQHRMAVIVYQVRATKLSVAFEGSGASSGRSPVRLTSSPVNAVIMTQFEYVTVAVSMILALSFARLLGALGHVLAPGRRYWIHALWCLIMLPAPLGF